MPGVGCDRQHLVLVSIERVDIKSQFLIPEGVVEPLEQSGSLGTQRLRAVRLSERLENLSHADPGTVDVALQLAQRLRPLHKRAIGIHDRIARILPGHVLVADWGARLVLLKPIAVAVAVFVDPGEASFRRRHMPFQQPFVAGRAPSCVQGYQIERRRIRGSVIGCVRDELEMRKLAIAQFVEDFAWFGIAVWVIVLGLQ